MNPAIYDYPNTPKPPRKVSTARWVILALVLISISFKLGYDSGKKGFVLEPKEFKVINQNQAPKDVDYQLLWDALRVVQDKYIEKSPTPDKILYGAVKGAVESFGDPYTTFFEPKTLESFKSDLAGQFDGIGAEIGKKEGNIVIVAPLDDMPAQKAGVLAGDIVVQVDGQSSAGWSVEDAVGKIRGQRGTKVTLTLYREGKPAPFDVEIIRDKIEIKSVKWEFKEIDGGKTIAVIRLTKFGDDTEALFEKAVNEILTKNVSGIVLDVRNNPGGYLQTSVELASFWVESGKLVVKEARSQGGDTDYNALGRNRLKDIKTVVLINGGSASAAEILSGALQDYGIAKLIGEKSFGKGSVQELVNLCGGFLNGCSDEEALGAVKVTVAKWITPNGKNLNKDGLHPDIEVKLTEEDIKAQKDPQMEKAIEEITK